VGFLSMPKWNCSWPEMSCAVSAVTSERGFESVEYRTARARTVLVLVLDNEEVKRKEKSLLRSKV
jgi:hypothetical protein